MSKTKCVSNSKLLYQIIDQNYYKSNIVLPSLEKELDSFKTDNIFYYIIDSVGVENGRLVQHGCGPNFEGGVISLCTCKHLMRASCTLKQVNWVAGITSRSLNKKVGQLGGNFLFFLFKIEKTFDSHFDIYKHYLEKNMYKTINSKNSSLKNNVFGDLFVPLSNKIDKFLPKHYKRPTKNHKHFENDDWNYDVSMYQFKVNKKPHKLLLGNNENSFIWSEPIIYLKNKYRTINSGHRINDISSFLKMFKQK